MNSFKKTLDKITSLNGKAPKFITRILRYSFTGTSTGTLDLVLLIILVEIFNIHYLYAATVAFVATHSLAFYINTKWGFKDSKASRKTGYFKYIGFGLIGIIVTVYLLRFGVETLGIHYLISRILVGLIVGFFNFTMNYFITFKMGSELWKKKK